MNSGNPFDKQDPLGDLTRRQLEAFTVSPLAEQLRKAAEGSPAFTKQFESLALQEQRVSELFKAPRIAAGQFAAMKNLAETTEKIRKVMEVSDTFKRLSEAARNFEKN